MITNSHPGLPKTYTNHEGNLMTMRRYPREPGFYEDNTKNENHQDTIRTAWGCQVHREGIHQHYDVHRAYLKVDLRNSAQVKFPERYADTPEFLVEFRIIDGHPESTGYTQAHQQQTGIQQGTMAYCTVEH